jgi:hypothetical protein
MPNAIKYNLSAETLALKKGNFWIGTGDVGKGPTSSTGYYNGVTPPSGGYTIYLNKETGGPSIYTVNTEAQLTGLTSTIAGVPYTTSGQCLNWFTTQTDKMVFNIDYPAIVTDGLVLNLDAGFTPSYPTTNIYFSDLSGSVTYSIKNIGIPLNQWLVKRSDITEITNNSITPPFYNAQVWSSVINRSDGNTLHRTWGDGSVNGVIGNLGQGYYRYYMWVRGKSTNTSSCSFQMDISDGSGGFASSGNVLIGQNEEWRLISCWDNGGINYNGSKFFDFFLNGVIGDTYYISSIAIIRSDVQDPVNLKSLYTFPGYINYGGVTTSGLQGLVTNGPTYSSTDGGGIVFDGIDDIIYLPFVLDTSTNFTIEVTIKNTTMISEPTPQNRQTVWAFTTDTSQGYQLLDLEIWNNGVTSFNGNNVSYTTSLNSNFILGDANSTKIYTLSKSGSSQSWYVNSELKGVANQTYTGISQYFKLGGRAAGSSGGGQPWNGPVYIVRIYNRALTSTEILQNYNAQKSRFGL